jgi:hypothetical protein
MESVLLYADSRIGSAYVVEVHGEEAEQLMSDCGPDIENWPYDFGIFEKGNGLYIWEGEMSDEEKKVRELKAHEWTHVHRNERVLSE